MRLFLLLFSLISIPGLSQVYLDCVVDNHCGNVEVTQKCITKIQIKENENGELNFQIHQVLHGGFELQLKPIIIPFEDTDDYLFNYGRLKARTKYIGKSGQNSYLLFPEKPSSDYWDGRLFLEGHEYELLCMLHE